MTNPTVFPTTISSTCTGYLADTAGLFTVAECTGTIPTTANVFQIGCSMIKTDQSAGLSPVYINTGTSASPVWTESAGGAGVQLATVSLTSTQIKALNTTPIQLVAAPGTGKAIQVLGVMGSLTFLTAAYATHTELDIIDTTGTTVLFKDTGTLLAATSSTVATIQMSIASNAANLVTANGSVSVTVPTGNPATGAGSLKLYVTYQVITL
jgi:hypothetical protein